MVAGGAATPTDPTAHVQRHLLLLLLMLQLRRGGAHLDVGTAGAVGGGPGGRGGCRGGRPHVAARRGGRGRGDGVGAAAGRRTHHVQRLGGGAEGAGTGEVLRVGGFRSRRVLVVAHPRVVLERRLSLDRLAVHTCRGKSNG